MWFFAILVVLALGGVALLAAGRGAPMVEVYDDRPDSSVPKPPGITTKPCEYFRNMVLRAKK